MMISFFLKPHYWIGGGSNLPGWPEPGVPSYEKKKKKKCKRRRTFKIEKKPECKEPEAIEIDARDFVKELYGERKARMLKRIEENERRRRRKRKSAAMALLKFLDEL